LQIAQDEVAKAASPRHALEVALLRAVHLAPAGSLPELVARVEALSRKEPAQRVSRSLLPDASARRAISPEPEPTPEPERESEQEPRPLDLRARWRLLIDAVRAARKAMLATALENAVPLSISREAVRIAFKKGDVMLPQVGDADARAAIEAAFEKALGFRAPLQVVEQEAPAEPSVAEQKQKLRAEAQSSRIAVAREHPAVRAAVEVLGGEIEDVRDLGEE